MSIFEKAVAAIGVYLVVALVMIVLVTKKQDDPVASKALWKKFFVYLLLIAGMMSAIHYGLLLFVALLIVVAGFGEMLFVASKAGPQPKPGKVLFSLVVYLFFAFGFSLLGFEHERMILVLYTGIVIFDGFSQLSGQLFGKRKLFPSVSPGKTLEGFAGGTLMLIPVGWWLLEDMSLPYAALFAVIFAAVALGGDLLASKYKRICGVKDYSRLLPGHGGILDRFDGFIAVSAAWMYFSFLVFFFCEW